MSNSKLVDEQVDRRLIESEKRRALRGRFANISYKRGVTSLRRFTKEMDDQQGEADRAREAAVDREELLQRVAEVRGVVREQIGVAALMIMPTKTCDQLVSGLLDSLNGLEALLRAKS